MKGWKLGLGIGAIGLASLVGCEERDAIKDKVNIQNSKGGKPINISGVPISVVSNCNGSHFSGNIATVIKMDKKLVLAYKFASSKMIAQIHALIDSEMVDGDNEPIILNGKYITNIFYFNSIKANGYELK